MEETVLHVLKLRLIVFTECEVCGGDGTTCGGGCTDPSACNYNPSSDDDCMTTVHVLGETVFVLVFLTKFSSSDPLGTGATTYRLYANFTADAAEVTAVYGTDTEPWWMTSSASDGFYNDAVGSDFGGGVNPAFFTVFPSLEYDSWFTIGAQPGDADG